MGTEAVAEELLATDTVGTCAVKCEIMGILGVELG
jgi:hypothetical protein